MNLVQAINNTLDLTLATDPTAGKGTSFKLIIEITVAMFIRGEKDGLSSLCY